MKRPHNVILATAIAALLAFPAAALAWQTNYVYHVDFNPGGIGLSAFNSSLRYNEMRWEEYAGQTFQIGQVTYCDSSYVCQPYTYACCGFVSEGYGISYGRAKCNSWSGNTYKIFVQDCFVHN